MARSSSRGAHPPGNELPALLATEPLIWRSSRAALVVLALEVYSSGIEFTIVGRTRDEGLAACIREPRFIGQAISGKDDDLRFAVLSSDEIVRVDLLGSIARQAQLPH